MSVQVASPESASVSSQVLAATEKRGWLRSPVFWLVVLAFAVRIAFMLGARTYLFEAYRYDEYSYHNEATNIARSIAEGRGFSSPFSADYTGPTAWIAPVYPYLVAFFFRLFGEFSTNAAIALMLLQSAFSALTCVPIVAIGDRCAGRRAGSIAALLWAVFPWFSKWAVCWIWEVSLSALLFTVLFWCALRLADGASRKMWLGYGALWGFALLVNPALLTLLPASLIWCAYKLRKGWLRHTVAAGIVCLVVISPWLVRNRIVFGHWAFLRGNFGFEFWLGNARYATPRGWVKQHPMGNPEQLALYRTMGEPAFVQAKLEDALSAVRENPGKFMRTSLDRVGYFWDGSAMGYRPRVAWFWLPGSFAVLSFLLLPSMLAAILRRMYAWPLFFGALLLYPVPYYLTFSQVRYRHALEPLMLVLLCCLIPKSWVDPQQ